MILLSADQTSRIAARGIAVGQDVADPHCSAHRQPCGGCSDVVAIERPLELDLRDRLVRLAAGCLDILTESDDRQHPATGADQIALRIQSSPGMDDHAAVAASQPLSQ